MMNIEKALIKESSWLSGNYAQIEGTLNPKEATTLEQMALKYSRIKKWAPFHLPVRINLYGYRSYRLPSSVVQTRYLPKEHPKNPEETLDFSVIIDGKRTDKFLKKF